MQVREDEIREDIFLMGLRVERNIKERGGASSVERNLKICGKDNEECG